MTKTCVNFSMSNMQTRTTFEMFYQNVRVLRTKQPGLIHNVCSMDFQIMCLTETRLHGMCFDHK